MIEYILLLPYSSFCFSFLSIIFVSGRFVPKLSKNKPLKVISVVLFLLIDYIVLTKLFEFGIIFSVIHGAFITGFLFLLLEALSVIGITGNICAGKSLLVDYLKKNINSGFINLDELNRRVLQTTSVINEIKRKFGNDVFIFDEVSRKEVLNKMKMRSIIYSDKKKKKQLEMITHPKVMTLFLKELINLKLVHRQKNVFIENAILLKVPFLKLFCKNIISVVVKDKNVLVKRIMQRDGCNEEQALKVLGNQSSYEDFVRESHYVIENDGTVEEFMMKIDQVLRLVIKN